jgi:hypothetical protein
MKTKDEVEAFLKVLIHPKEVLKDILELSKKKPNDAVNEFKLSFVNTILEKANAILVKGYKPFDSFDTFNEDSMPTNSDVVLILSQYVGCLKKFGRDNTRIDEDDFIPPRYFWVINNKRSKIEVDINIL